MKKIVVVALFFAGMLASTSAFAGNTDDPDLHTELNTNNGKSNVEDKKKSKYTFTLFTFFKPQEQETKTDSVNVKATPVRQELKEKLNSDL